MNSKGEISIMYFCIFTWVLNMKIKFFCFILLNFTVCEAASQQDSYILRNMYGDTFQMNPRLKKCRFLEQMAQIPTCVAYHKDHKHTDSKVARRLKSYYGAVISCTGGCKERSSNWSRDHPAKIFYQYRRRTVHYKNIMKSKYIGCSAAYSNGRYCPFCYLSNKCL